MVKIINIYLLIFFLSSCLIAEPLNESLLESQKFNYKESLKILKKTPQSSEILKHLAWAYMKVGNYTKASEIFSKVNQNDYEVLFGLGLSYFFQDDSEKSEMYFTKCFEINRNCAASEFFLGELKSSQELFEEAIKHYKNTLKLDSHFIEARLKLAEVYYILKKYNDSFREYTKILNIDPKNKKSQKQKEILLALITKKPEEIVPPKRISDATKITLVKEPEKIPLLRVGILKNNRETKLWSESGLVIMCEGKIFSEINPKEIFILNSSFDCFKNKKFIVKPKIKNSTIIIQDIKYAEGFAWAGVSDMEYRGFFEVNFTSVSFSLVNIVNLEEYLYSVLPSEMISWWLEEALKTQSVISRSEAVYRKDVSKPHSNEGFDLCSEQHCQVYNGVKQETPSSRKLVDSTRGEVVEYNGKIAHTIYSSNCSGHTQSSKELKGWADVSYWQGEIDGEINFPNDMVKFDRWLKHPPDIFCAPSKYTYYAESRWMRVINQEMMSEWLNRTYKLGGIKKIIPIKRSKSGHINYVRIEGTKGNIEIEKENLIRAMVLGRLRSTNFIVEGYGKTSGLPKYFIFWGAGWGHGVGLCQSGVVGMIEKGYKYTEILKKYYKGTKIRKVEY